MRKKVIKTSSRLILSLCTVAGLTLALSTPANAAPRTTFQTTNLSATVTNKTVKVVSEVRTSRTTKVNAFSVCVRDSSGKNYDFSPKNNITITRYGTTYNATKTFPAGKYSYFSCIYSNGKWWGSNSKTFTVKSTNTTPAPTPNPTPTPAPTPTPTPAPNPTPAPSSSMPVGNLPGWKQNYTQNFTKDAPLGQVGKVYDSSTRGYDGFNDTSGHGLYAPDKVLSVSNGVLNYNLHSENNQPLVAAPTLNNYQGQTYGKYSVRFRADKAPGYKIAFLLWPSSDNWNEGEIDFPEGNLNDTKMRPASAVPGSYNNGRMTFEPEQEYYAPTDSTGWHVATTEWTPSGVKWYWDGKLIASTSKAVPSTNFRWTLQAETAIGSAAPASNVSGNVQVDWAVSYNYDPNTAQ